MDMNQYMDAFVDESNEHLMAINENLLALEKAPDNEELVQQIFRSAHTLKGMSATMGFDEIAQLTHHLENVLDKVRHHELQINTALMDLFFSSVEALEQLVEAVINGTDANVDLNQIISELNQALGGEGMEDNAPVISSNNVVQKLDQFALTVLRESVETGYSIFYMRVALEESCLLKAARAYMVFSLLENEGEIIQSNPSVQEIEEEAFDTSFEVIYVSKREADYLQQVVLKVSEIEHVEIDQLSVEELSKQLDQGSSPVQDEVAAATATAVQTKNDVQKTDSGSQSRFNKTIRVNIDRLDALMNLFSELVIDRGRLEQIARDLQHQELLETVEHMSRISSDLQDLILTMRMVPVEQVFNRFPRMVRSLARELGKEVDLIMSGAETELDRTVIDEIGDPLVHLLRNAIDHGLETTEERRQIGKPTVGRVELKAFHSGNHVFIEIADDGKGIDRDKVGQKAIEQGLVTEEALRTMSDHEVFQLLFASGFSTAQEVSDISGRGVGLDVVKTKIEALGGNVEVHSERGIGTTFSVQLPLTLSIISALLIVVAEETYAIPLTSIIEAIAVRKEEIRTVHGQRVLDFRGKVIPLVSLHNVFEAEGEPNDEEMLSIVIVRKGDKLAGLVVDALIGQQEIVLKSMGRYLSQVFAISGATILGDGQVALIIDCNALID